VGLGDSDANARWVGIRRHQAVVIIVGLGLVGDWIIVPRPKLVELVVGVLALSCAMPVYDGLTAGEMVSVALKFVLRRRWSFVTVQRDDAATTIQARGVVVVRGFELLHRGRLDLSGSDFELAAKIVDLVKGRATSHESSHVSIHVRSSRTNANTLLTLPTGGSTPEGWFENGTLLEELLGVASGDTRAGELERWNYVRNEEEVFRTLRVVDFSGAPGQRALLEKLQQSSRHPDIALHVDVLSGAKANRVASRAVHQSSSDSAASSAVGFRRSARSKRVLQRLTQREEFVAEGDALLRIAVFVTVRASSRVALREACRDVIRSAEESGLRFQRGAGRQILWHSFQLPGGPGW